MKPHDPQPDLFAQPAPGTQRPPIRAVAMPHALARNTDPATSHAAAARVEPHLAALCVLVTEALRAAGERGATTKELGKLTAHHRDSISPRMRTLVTAGICIATDERRGGCIVWRAL